jgi:hypothetical protein
MHKPPSSNFLYQLNLNYIKNRYHLVKEVDEIFLTNSLIDVGKHLLYGWPKFFMHLHQISELLNFVSPSPYDGRADFAFQLILNLLGEKVLL